ncbi:hypothetical protein INT47_000942 [Mucor saturninus]|uniref:Uncharacterized protein n=1 Tax=Mucor saturninus TaxID=64648 RepID=A0A8H7V8S7_9FUNG|nr:hypothetical protein INT47_000942 [Mucor saturninus]
MDSTKSKRFSFAGFSSGLSRSLSFSSGTKVKKEEVVAAKDSNQEELRKLSRAQKSKSLYVKSFNKKTPATQFDASEAVQSNSKEIRSSIRRSLSAVLYASPHSTDDDKSYSNKLVPVLVTPGLSESLGGILIDDGSKNKMMNNEKTTEKSVKKKRPVEYDNSLEIVSEDKETTIIWQGYGYTITAEGQEEVSSEMITETDLESRFEKEIWKSYCGLIHPLHLFQELNDEQEVVNRGRWAGLSVTELRRYFDNYGSMLLKIRESRMLEQQKHYQCLDNVKKEWIIPDITNNTNITV